MEDAVPGASVGLTLTRLDSTHGENPELDGVTPVPLREITAGEFVALLVTVMLPVNVPDIVGAKVTFKVAVFPRLRISPTGSPLELKPGPETPTVEIVTSELPALASVTARVLLLPRFTFPKLRLDLLAVSCAEGSAVLAEVRALVKPVHPDWMRGTKRTTQKIRQIHGLRRVIVWQQLITGAVLLGPRGMTRYWSMVLKQGQVSSPVLENDRIVKFSFTTPPDANLDLMEAGMQDAGGDLKPSAPCGEHRLCHTKTWPGSHGSLFEATFIYIVYSSVLSFPTLLTG